MIFLLQPQESGSGGAKRLALEMRTMIEIDAKLLEKVLLATGEKSKSEAVHTALEKYVRDWAIEGLRSIAGKVDIEDNWRELEEMELEDMRNLSW